MENQGGLLISMSYLLNTNSKTIHYASSRDGRCKISTMREEYKLIFKTLQQAKEYPSKESHLAKKCCSFCLPNEKV